MYANPTLFPAVTNRETWDPIIQIADDDTGELIDLDTVTFQLEVRKLGTRNDIQDTGYAPYYDYGASVYGIGPVLTASLGDGIEIIDTGTIQVTFTETQMATLIPDTYSVACTCTDGTTTRQLFLGRLPVLDGRVTT